MRLPAGHLQGQVFQPVRNQPNAVVIADIAPTGMGDAADYTVARSDKQGFIGVAAAMGAAEGTGLSGAGIERQDSAVAYLGGKDPARRGQGHQQGSRKILRIVAVLLRSLNDSRPGFAYGLPQYG